MKVQDILAESARRWPTRPAIADEGGVLSYQDLGQQVEDARRRLLGLGVGPGQGLGLVAPNGRRFIIGAFAALTCGATVFPIFHQLKRAEFDALLDEAAVDAVLHGGGGPPLPGASAALEIPGAAPLVLARTGKRWACPLAGAAPDAAFVRFTSGTTGASKGVLLTHASVLERTAAANRGLGLTSQDVVLWTLPMAFHFFVSIVLYLRVGAKIVVCRDHLAETVLEAAAAHGGTFLYAAPLDYRLLAAEGSGRRLPDLRLAISTSTALPPPAAGAFAERYGRPVAQAYGIIEVGLPLINLEYARERPESVGRALPDYRAAVLDERCRPVPDGQTGELALSGPGMFAGYLSPPRLASEVLRDGWFLTGDLARRDAEGCFSVVGRSKSMINVAGNKVFPEEVERVLDGHPLVAASRVSGRPHERMGEVVHAEVVLKDGAGAVDVEGLLAFCRRSLSAFKVPFSVSVVPGLEETASGKLRRWGARP